MVVRTPSVGFDFYGVTYPLEIELGLPPFVVLLIVLVASVVSADEFRKMDDILPGKRKSYEREISCRSDADDILIQIEQELSKVIDSIRVVRQDQAFDASDTAHREMGTERK